MNNRIKMLAYISLGSLFFMASVSAYVISHNRVIFTPTPAAPVYIDNKSAVLPEYVVIPRSQILELNSRCHASGGTIGYQSGYDDACDNILSGLGMRSGFRTRPDQNLTLSHDSTQYIKFPYKDNVFTLNNSIYRVALKDHNRQISLQNCTGLSLNYPYTWEITYRYIRQNTSKYYENSSLVDYGSFA